MLSVLFPALYELNTRVRLAELSVTLGRAARFDDIPEDFLDELARAGMDWLWLLGAWQTGPEGRRIARSIPGLVEEYRRALPDYQEEDCAGSCFAVQAYTPLAEAGGEAALRRLRPRLHERGMRLMLDFVPNHTARDHPWVEEHPEYYIQGSEGDLEREPGNYCRIETAGGSRIFAHGRDPYFPGWTDTLQLNYAEPALQQAMLAELLRVASLCDGVRCDMAMLLLPDVFERTWGRRPERFWPEAIRSVRDRKPDFVFMAEVYWDREWELQQQGFDYTYDKRLYDRLRAQWARPVREHFLAEFEYQRRSVRFLENHDEHRAASTFAPEPHRAAAVLSYLCPGLRFYHDGQFEGRKFKLPVQLLRAPQEPADAAIRRFYARLLECARMPAVNEGCWQLLECLPAWEDNPTWDDFVCFAWEGMDERRLLVAVNYSAHPSQCFVRFPFLDAAGWTIRLQDLLSPAAYDRPGNDLLRRGLYLDLPDWGFHVFEVSALV